MVSRLQGATALVAGDVSRIGGAVERLVQAGVHVTVQAQGTDETAAAVALAGSITGPGTCRPLERPVRSFADADDVVATFDGEGRGLDILLAPRMPGDPRGILELDEDEWRGTQRDCLKRTVGLARASARHFVAGGRTGRVVTFSAADTFGGEGSASAALNAAMLSLTSAMAATLQEHGVTVNCVALGHEEPQGSGESARARAGLGGLVEHLCAGAEMTGRFFYCSTTDIGLYAMPMDIASANMRIRLTGESNENVGELLRPLMAVGRG